METIRIYYSICAHYHADVHCLHCSSEFGVAGSKYSREIQERSRKGEIELLSVKLGQTLSCINVSALNN